MMQIMYMLTHTELAHHWFGNLVTATSRRNHWLQEGFATFYGLLAAQEVLGEDYLYAKLIETAQELENHNLPDQGEAILDTGNSYLTYYFKGLGIVCSSSLCREKVLQRG